MGAVLHASTQMCIAATTKQIRDFMSDAVMGMDVDLHLILCLQKAVAYVIGENSPGQDCTLRRACVHINIIISLLA